MMNLYAMRGCLSILIGFAMALPCLAQTERYELGKRLRRFELTWQTAAEDMRVRANDPMLNAVKSFFGLQLPKAAKHLDEAYLAVRSSSAATPFESWLLSQRLSIQPVAVDSSVPTLQVQLKSFYKIDGEQATHSALGDRIQVQLRLRDAAGQESLTLAGGSQEILDGRDWQLANINEGDYWVELMATLDGQSIVLPTMEVSVIKDARARLSKLDQWLKTQAASTERTDRSETLRLTVRQFVQTITSQLEGRPLETDYPAVRLLKVAEAIVQEPAKANELLQQEALAGLWMTLSHHKQSLPVRVQLPLAARQSKEPIPVLLAFHGAGGSENMFFETYGAGRLVQMALDRGWIVVAPRHPLLGMPLSYREMLETLSDFYPIDPSRVYLVGHSMGGAEVARQVGLDARAPQAAVVIGGGGQVKDCAAVKAVPWLVAAGQFDFGRGGAQALSRRLEQLGCQVEYQDQAKVEHMVIVQAVLDDVFKFLDRQAQPAH